MPEEAAAGWIAGNSRSAKTAAEAQELKTRIQSALEGHREADLLDVRTMESLHNAVYKPAAGQLPRAFRSSSDPVFMGSDIARSGFEKALAQIEAKSVAGQVDLADALYAAVVRYHPFGDGNGRTARAIYALARLQKGERPFMALNKQAEDILNPPGPLAFRAQGLPAFKRRPKPEAGSRRLSAPCPRGRSSPS
ncbi:Fic family protein [Chromobacterium haemolyticum]|nr:Fic family protein [Chromobacterium haemolyticum]